MKLYEVGAIRGRKVSNHEVEEAFSDPEIRTGLSAESFIQAYAHFFEDRYEDADYDSQLFDSDAGTAWFWYENGRWPPTGWSPFHGVN